MAEAPLPHEAALLMRETARARAVARQERRGILLWQIGLLGALLVGWSLASGRVVDRLFLSDPVAVGRALWALVTRGPCGSTCGSP